MSSNFRVHQLPIGPADNFIYLLADTERKEVAVVDPAWDVPAILQEVEAHGYTITKILLTHGHGDHTNGVEELLRMHPVPLYLSSQESEQFRLNIAGMIELDDGDTVSVGSAELSVIHTPGHCPGGQCFLYEKHLIAGDTVFIDGCGRCDLPGSDAAVMYDSIHNRVMTLPDETIIYPGHNYGPTPTDTLGNQKQTNRFMVVKSEAEFIKARMG